MPGRNAGTNAGTEGTFRYTQSYNSQRAGGWAPLLSDRDKSRAHQETPGINETFPYILQSQQIRSLGCSGNGSERNRRLRLTPQHQVESRDVRDHQQRHVQHGSHVRRAQLPGHSRKPGARRVVVVRHQVRRAAIPACPAGRLGLLRAGILNQILLRLHRLAPFEFLDRDTKRRIQTAPAPNTKSPPFE